MASRISVGGQAGAQSSSFWGRLVGLDAMRGLAVTAVVVFHVAPAALPGGFVGVDVFFVVSGFLITTLLLRELDSSGTIDVWSFMKRRTRRLVPAAVLAVAVTGLLALMVGGDVLVGVPAALFGMATLTSNWVQLFQNSDYFARTSAGLYDNFWSLAIEEQFYLIWPFALLALWRHLSHARALTALTTLTLLAAVLPLTLGLAGLSEWAYLSTFSHSFGLLLGATTAVFLRRVQAPAAAPVTGIGSTGGALAAGVVGLIALVVMMVSPVGTQPLLRPALTVFGSIAALFVMLGLLRAASVVAARADRGPAGWLGRRAYGLYLWHFPLIVLADAVIPAVPGWGKLPGRVLAVVTAVAAAELSYRFVERAVRQKGFRGVLARPRGAVVAVGLASTLALTSCGIATNAPDKTTATAGAAAQGQVDSAVPVPASAERAVAIGDSVMLASESGLKGLFPGITVDARVDRQLAGAAQLVDTHLSKAPKTTAIVIGLGINGVGGAADLRKIVAAAKGLPVIFLTVAGPVAWESSVNADIRSVASEYSNVAVADWKAAADAHPRLIASDGVHPGSGGGKLYAESVLTALKSLE